MADHYQKLISDSHLGLDRLSALLEKLGPNELNVSLPNEWAVSVTLAHLAFWDQWVVARWRRFHETGCLEDIDESVMDLINEAALPAWTALEPETTVRMALASARLALATVSSLPDDAKAPASETGRNAMLDRSLHWDPHLHEISKALDG